jgi:glutathione S-transferase
MLELYHWEPNGASARVLIALKEKGIAFESRWVDLHAFEQHDPEFLSLNESGQVPVLVQDGEAFNESSYICEYLEEAFEGPGLMPAEPLARWEARAWQKYVDDHFAQAVSELAWNRCRPKFMMGSPDKAPTRERRHAWAEAIEGYSHSRLEQANERIGLAIERIEERLAQSGWLAGDAFSLADIAVFSYAYYLSELTPQLLAGAPQMTAWLRNVAARPAVEEALAMTHHGAPFATAAPGPERVRWG